MHQYKKKHWRKYGSDQFHTRVPPIVNAMLTQLHLQCTQEKRVWNIVARRQQCHNAGFSMLPPSSQRKTQSGRKCCTMFSLTERESQLNTAAALASVHSPRRLLVGNISNAMEVLSECARTSGEKMCRRWGRREQAHALKDIRRQKIPGLRLGRGTAGGSDFAFYSCLNVRLGRAFFQRL